MEEASLAYMTQYLFVLLLRKEGRQYGITKTNKGLRTLHRTYRTEMERIELWVSGAYQKKRF
jgi:hypothetical protein